MYSKRTPWQVWGEGKFVGPRGKRKAKDRMGRAYSKETKKREKTWQEGTRLEKNRNKFRIRLMQPDT
jgi:hypothetical protein